MTIGQRIIPRSDERETRSGQWIRLCCIGGRQEGQPRGTRKPDSREIGRDNETSAFSALHRPGRRDNRYGISERRYASCKMLIANHRVLGASLAPIGLSVREDPGSMDRADPLPSRGF